MKGFSREVGALWLRVGRPGRTVHARLAADQGAAAATVLDEMPGMRSRMMATDNLSDIRHGGWRRLLAKLLLLGLAACAPGDGGVPPGVYRVDGVLHVETPQSSFTVEIPPDMIDVAGGDHHLVQGQRLVFRREVGDWHTYVASVAVQTIAPEDWREIQAALAAESEAAIIARLADRLESGERASPGRSGNVLLHYRRPGGARLPHAALGLTCAERAFIAEDRQVPGQGDRLFHLYFRDYTCLDPLSRWPVDLTWSERFPADRHRLPATLAADATAFFESLRFTGTTAAP